MQRPSGHKAASFAEVNESGCQFVCDCMNLLARVAEAGIQQQTLPSQNPRISTRLVAINLTIQVADILVMALLARRGFFRMNVSPIAHLLGLNQLASWMIWKTSSFVLLIEATLAGRRRLILFLNFFFAGFLMWSVLMIWMSIG